MLSPHQHIFDRMDAPLEENAKLSPVREMSDLIAGRRYAADMPCLAGVGMNVRNYA
jgi:hypothetical protein